MQTRSPFAFFALSVHGGSIIEIEKQVLLEESMEMFANGDELKNFKRKDICEGKVKTTRQTVVLGTLTGYLFDATLESQRGKVEISYGVQRELIGRYVESKKELLKSKYGDLFRESKF